MINGKSLAVAPEWQDEALLHVLREHLGLVGTKFGCGVAQCGACTVLLDGETARSCVLPAKAAVGKAITTIEGLADGAILHPIQTAWLAHAVPQCGYCQAGQIMASAALLKRIPKPSDAQIDEGLAGNLCRCATHQRIRMAIKETAGLLK